MTYIYFEVKCRVILTHNPKRWCSYIKLSSKYKTKSLDHEIWVTVTYIYFYVKRLVILTHNSEVNVYTSNSLQDIWQNHWTMKYRSQWPTFILRSHIRSYCFIIPKYDVHTSNRLQDIRQNHWTVKYGSCWPSLHDPQVNVTRLTKVQPPIFPSCFHNRKVEKNF